VGNKQDLYDKIMEKPLRSDIRFNDMHNFLLNNGFILKKSNGSSHNIYKHNKYEQIINIQSVGGLVKRYQVSQVQKAIEFIGGN
jgi:predicted RNA binding protein YcfA (HicA-like mRNA interferase family)